LEVLFQEKRSLYQTCADKPIELPEHATRDGVSEEIIQRIFNREKWSCAGNPSLPSPMENVHSPLFYDMVVSIMIRFKRIPQGIQKRIDSLTPVFISDPNVIFAYLFGGLSRKRQNLLSDVDIALFVKNINKLDYLDLLGAIANALGTEEIDLVILNNAPLSLTGRILKNRKILIDKDPFLRHRYESLLLREFFDFTIKEREILQRRYGIGR
jgi:uncharacterized protein